MARVTIRTLAQKKQSRQKIPCLTAYDAAFAALLEAEGVDVLLVGDSLGMVVQGQDSTLPVTLEHMEYHTACVARGTAGALVVADMPFASFHHPRQALDNAARLMRAGAHMVKVEGGEAVLETVGHLTAFGIPVCGHLGLLPQSVHKLGGYRVQGMDPTEGQRIVAAAEALELAGADLLVLECVPADLAADIAARLAIPVIGIGAGAHCDGQVLVLYDMLGVSGGKPPRFCRDFSLEGGGVRDAVRRYVQAVKAVEFPAPEHEYGAE